jgi:hypothetical protein
MAKQMGRRCVLRESPTSEQNAKEDAFSTQRERERERERMRVHTAIPYERLVFLCPFRRTSPVCDAVLANLPETQNNSKKYHHHHYHN